MPESHGPFRDVPFMGVIYVVAEAAKLGYHGDHPDWCNLGQGMPEVGELPGAPDRLSKIEIAPADHAYGPVEGVPELREAVAELYNHQFRRGKASRYRAENVAITAGGRLALTRAIWAVDAVRLGYFTPDYTAYEDLLGGISRIRPIHIPLPPEDGFGIDPERLAREVEEHDLQALLISNPCNPTGHVIRDERLAAWIRLARQREVGLLVDEFYSHFIWRGEAPVSAAAHVEDVNADPVLLFDGLTKNFRYPGWRVGWTLGPRDWIDTVTRSGSALDGGPPRWLQRAAQRLVEPARAGREMGAMREAFRRKHDLMVERLTGMGVELFPGADGTFYCWGSVAGLPEPLNDGMRFFREALKHRVTAVPGEFFDVNPGKRRGGSSRLAPYVRFSFGPPYPVVERGLTRLAAMVDAAS